MRNTDCIFLWQDSKTGKTEHCSEKTKYSGDIYQYSDNSNRRHMPMIDFEFCEEHYQEGLKDPNYTLKNVKKL
tara:strand:- start:4551 stop:4769 length:219 start_codon:yes stop_codon:yes gene_type:complete